MLFPGRTKMYCLTPLINRAQNYSRRLCLTCVLPTGMSHVSIISSVTHTARLYSSKWFSLENSNTLMENSTLHIICQDQGIEARGLWKERGKNKDLTSIHMIAKGSCSGQGQTFTGRHCLEPALCASLPCRASSPRGGLL